MAPAYDLGNQRSPFQKLARLCVTLHLMKMHGQLIPVKKWVKLIRLLCGVTATRAIYDYTETAEDMGFIERRPKEGVVFKADYEVVNQILGFDLQSLSTVEPQETLET